MAVAHTEPQRRAAAKIWGPSGRARELVSTTSEWAWAHTHREGHYLMAMDEGSSYHNITTGMEIILFRGSISVHCA